MRHEPITPGVAQDDRVELAVLADVVRELGDVLEVLGASRLIGIARDEPVEVCSATVCRRELDPLPATNVPAVEILVFGWLQQLRQDLFEAGRIVRIFPVDRHGSRCPTPEPGNDVIGERIVHGRAEDAGIP